MRTQEEKNPKENEKNSKEFGELVWYLSKLPPEAREKVAIYAQGVLAMAELKGA